MNGEGADVLKGALAFDYDGYEAFMDVGDYTITPSGLSSDNYDFNYQTGTLTVVPLEIEATWEVKSYTYTGSALTLPTAYALGVNGERFALLVSPSFAGGFKNAGDYLFKAELNSADAGAKNYALKENTAAHTYTVEKQEVAAPSIASKVYNGTRQTAEVPTSTLYTVTENNGGTNAGDYNVKLTLTAAASENYKWAGSETEEILLTFAITKADYDMSGVTFEDLTLDYDGKAHGIEITGALPEGVTVTYDGNGKTDVGVYTVTANFTGDAQNYNPIPSKEATLTILRVSHELSGIAFEDVTVKYDGEAHSIAVTGTLPHGVGVSYEGNGKIEPNVYTVTAVFSDHIGEFARKTAKLTILRTHAQVDLESDREAEIIVDSENGFNPTLELVAEKTENVARTYWVWEKDKVSEKYTVKTYKDGAEVPFDGKLTVRLLIPEAFRDRDFELETAARERIKYTRDGDYVVFEADGLSAYVFTSAYAPYIPVVIIMVVVLFVDALGMAALVFVYKHKKTTEE